MVTVKCRAKNPRLCRVHGTHNSPPASYTAYAIQREKEDAETTQRRIVLSLINTQLDQVDWEGYQEKTRALINRLVSQYGTPEIGRTRAVFDLNNGTVMKVAFTDEGELSNGKEVQASKTIDPFIPVAECYWSQVDDVDVVIMEKVTPVTGVGYKDLPDWAGYVDGAQVGYTRAGKLVAYDL